jgi:hypothetical protein
MDLKELSSIMDLNDLPGFPVKLEIPVLPSVKAIVDFQYSALEDDVDEHFFDVPLHYTRIRK